MRACSLSFYMYLISTSIFVQRWSLGFSIREPITKKCGMGAPGVEEFISFLDCPDEPGFVLLVHSICASFLSSVKMHIHQQAENSSEVGWYRSTCKFERDVEEDLEQDRQTSFRDPSGAHVDVQNWVPAQWVLVKRVKGLNMKGKVSLGTFETSFC